MKILFTNFMLTALISINIISCKPDETCSDGLLNQDETATDCGGICPACPTCSDGIQNQNETGVDCGGSCTACPTCSDGIKNGTETGVDCGGTCTACAEVAPCNNTNTDNKATLESTTLNLSVITCAVTSSWNTYEIKGVGNQGDVILRFHQTVIPTASKVYYVVAFQDLDTDNDVYIETKPIFQGTATSASAGGKLYLTVSGNSVSAEYCNIEFLSTAGSLFGSGRIICN